MLIVLYLSGFGCCKNGARRNQELSMFDCLGSSGSMLCGRGFPPQTLSAMKGWGLNPRFRVQMRPCPYRPGRQEEPPLLFPIPTYAVGD